VTPEKAEVIKRIFERSCLGKANLSEEGANRVIDTEAARGNCLYFYKCVYCGSHHMTKNPGDVQVSPYEDGIDKIQSEVAKSRTRAQQKVKVEK